MEIQHGPDSVFAASAAPSGGSAAIASREAARAGRGRTGTGVEGLDACGLSSEQLAAAFAASTDGVIATDGDGLIRVLNAAARRLFALGDRAESEGLRLPDWLLRWGVRDEHGRPLSEERLLAWRQRLQAGETLSRAEMGEMSVRGRDGQQVELGVSAAPVRSASGEVVGALWIVRDGSEPGRQRRWMREALAALVEMAETLVDAVPSTLDGSVDTVSARGRSTGRREARPLATAALRSSATGPAAQQVAQKLAQLARAVLGCRILDIIAQESSGSDLYLVASAGQSARALKRWRTAHPGHGKALHDLLRSDPDIAARLERGESIVVDVLQPEFAALPNAPGARSALATPMRLGGHLVGFLVLDYGPGEHTFTDEEAALAAGTARMAALVLERERLLCEREEAHASVLALRETNRRMDEFIAVAAHELRAPVQASLLGVGLATQHVRRLGRPNTVRAGAGERTSELEELRKDLAQTEESVERLARLIANLLDASRLQTGQFRLRPQPIDLTGVVREAVERQRLLTPERAFDLHLPRRETVLVDADAERISHVVGNLLTNAVKYAPEDRPVEVRVQVRGRRARVSLRDEGPGLSAEEQRQVWDCYHQVAGIQANPGTGTGLGLGLYIGRQIVRAHGGQVGVHSAPGRGAIFWFTLPLAAEEAREPPGQ